VEIQTGRKLKLGTSGKYCAPSAKFAAMRFLSDQNRLLK
jgi:hypothetical protein